MLLQLNAIERPELDKGSQERVKVFTPSEIRHIKPEDLEWKFKRMKKSSIKELFFYDIKEDHHRKIDFEQAVQKDYLCLDVCVSYGSTRAVCTLSIVETDIIAQLLLDIQDAKEDDSSEFSIPDNRQMYRLEDLCSSEKLKSAEGTKIISYHGRSSGIEAFSLDTPPKPIPMRIQGSYEVLKAPRRLTD